MFPENYMLTLKIAFPGSQQCVITLFLKSSLYLDLAEQTTMCVVLYEANNNKNMSSLIFLLLIPALFL